MKFDIVKKGYDPKQIDDYIDSVRSQYKIMYEEYKTLQTEKENIQKKYEEAQKKILELQNIDSSNTALASTATLESMIKESSEIENWIRETTQNEVLQIVSTARNNKVKQIISVPRKNQTKRNISMYSTVSSKIAPENFSEKNKKEQQSAEFTTSPTQKTSNAQAENPIQEITAKETSEWRTKAHKESKTDGSTVCISTNTFDDINSKKSNVSANSDVSLSKLRQDNEIEKTVDKLMAEFQSQIKVGGQ